MSRIEGVDNLIKKLNNLGGNSVAVVEKSIQQSTRLVLRDAKKNAPVNKKSGGGTLRQSIQAETYVSSEGVQGKVFTNCEYAPYVEYGTGQRGAASPSPPKSPENIKYSTDWNGMAAQPYLYPALAVNKEVIKEKLRADLRNAIRKHGGLDD